MTLPLHGYFRSTRIRRVALPWASLLSLVCAAPSFSAPASGRTLATTPALSAITLVMPPTRPLSAAPMMIRGMSSNRGRAGVTYGATIRQELTLRQVECVFAHRDHFSDVWSLEDSPTGSWNLPGSWNLTQDSQHSLAQMRTRPVRGTVGGGNTLLHIACLCDGPPDLIAQLVTGTPSFSVTSRNAYGRTPLHLAAEGNSHPEVIGILLDAGADIEAWDDGTPEGSAGGFHLRPEPRATPLYRAVVHNPHTEIITALLAGGADIETRGVRRRGTRGGSYLPRRSGRGTGSQREEGLTPLLAAVVFSSLEVVEALLAAGADVRVDQFAVDLASQPTMPIEPQSRRPGVRREPAAAILGRPSERDLGPTALHLAAAYRDEPKFIDVLVAAGADLEARITDRRRPQRFVKTLMNPGCRSSDTQIYPGDTPFHWAAESQEESAVLEALLSAGARLEATTCSGATALDMINDKLHGTEVYWRLHEAQYQR